MKRVIISIAILALIATLATGATIYTYRVTEQMLVFLETAEKEISAGDSPALMDTLDEMQQYYMIHDKPLMLFVRRDYVTNPQSSFCVLPAYAGKENFADFETELLRAKAQILQLRALFFSFL